MKKWICAILCLSMMAGVVSMDVSARSEGNANEEKMTLLDTAGVGAGNESASVESQKIETPAPTATPQPTLPPSAGTVVIDSEDVFTVTTNSSEKSCIITAYTGNAFATTICIPRKIHGNQVTAVADRVFANCFYLKNLVVYGDVEFQGSAAFASVAPVEIWCGSGTKTATYAAAMGKTVHIINGPGTVTVEKAAGLKKTTVTWAGVPEAVSYHVYRKQGKGSYSLVQNLAGLSLANEGLKPGAKYTYKIVPVFMSADQTTITGNDSKETVVSMVPAKPKKVKATGVRGGIQVRWKRNKNVNGYQVFMKVHVKGFKTKFNRVKVIKKNKITGYRCKMLVRGMKYSYRVRTYKTVKGKKIFSPFVTVTTKAK